MRESTYQAGLIKRLKILFPGCVILKNDPGYLQGFPDLTILYQQKWAVLEVKPYPTASMQPNQQYYIDELGEMSFAAVIFPENEEDILDALQQAFKPSRATRVSKRKQVSLDQL